MLTPHSQDARPLCRCLTSTATLGDIAGLRGSELAHEEGRDSGARKLAVIGVVYGRDGTDGESPDFAAGPGLRFVLRGVVLTCAGTRAKDAVRTPRVRASKRGRGRGEAWAEGDGARGEDNVRDGAPTGRDQQPPSMRGPDTSRSIASPSTAERTRLPSCHPLHLSTTPLRVKNPLTNSAKERSIWC